MAVHLWIPPIWHILPGIGGKSLYPATFWDQNLGMIELWKDAAKNMQWMPLHSPTFQSCHCFLDKQCVIVYIVSKGIRNAFQMLKRRIWLPYEDARRRYITFPLHCEQSILDLSIPHSVQGVYPLPRQLGQGNSLIYWPLGPNQDLGLGAPEIAFLLNLEVQCNFI